MGVAGMRGSLRRTAVELWGVRRGEATNGPGQGRNHTARRANRRASVLRCI